MDRSIVVWATQQSRDGNPTSTIGDLSCVMQTVNQPRYVASWMGGVVGFRLGWVVGGNWVVPSSRNCSLATKMVGYKPGVVIHHKIQSNWRRVRIYES